MLRQALCDPRGKKDPAHPVNYLFRYAAAVATHNRCSRSHGLDYHAPEGFRLDRRHNRDIKRCKNRSRVVAVPR